MIIYNNKHQYNIRDSAVHPPSVGQTPLFLQSSKPPEKLTQANINFLKSLNLQLYKKK